MSSKSKKQKNAEKYESPRNEFHFYLQQTAKSSVHKDKKKTIPRKQKYKKDF